ncbi:MAG: hypothetical protein OHK93_004652 [Ramalina farinacea]|uniref:EKC/KEOPS complex subunit GON7 n=1 Tax=Ramalina farinacea TaxID=258253 RepID=A0AA43TYX7_9LECA|nr:hypothetical protein [Ramalina farinacea]
MAPESSKNPSDNPSTLTASYTSPTSTKAFTHTLPTSAPSSAALTEEKTRYMSALRKSVVQLQGEINELLTEKMEEDKWVAAEKGVGLQWMRRRRRITGKRVGSIWREGRREEEGEREFRSFCDD